MVPSSRRAATVRGGSPMSRTGRRRIDSRRTFSKMNVVAPMLAVSDAAAAIEFYRAAFGAEERWRLGQGNHLVAGLRIGDAEVYLATESPEHGAWSPDRAGFTTVRIELFV